jgi:hypothetical protein
MDVFTRLQQQMKRPAADVSVSEQMRFTSPRMYPFWFGGRRRRAQAFAEGILRVRRLPPELEDPDQYRYWWLPETDWRGHVLRPARLSEREKQGYQVAEFHNLITNNGRSQVLTFIGSASGTTPPFTQQFAVGNGAISGVNATDTSLANEVFRKAPASYAVQGTEVDINIVFGTTDAEYTYTNAGIWGVSASGTLGSGVLMTHALFSYTKGAYAISIDYIINVLG